MKENGTPSSLLKTTTPGPHQETTSPTATLKLKIPAAARAPWPLLDTDLESKWQEEGKIFAMYEII